MLVLREVFWACSAKYLTLQIAPTRPSNHALKSVNHSLTIRSLSQNGTNQGQDAEQRDQHRHYTGNGCRQFGATLAQRLQGLVANPFHAKTAMPKAPLELMNETRAKCESTTESPVAKFTGAHMVP